MKSVVKLVFISNPASGSSKNKPGETLIRSFFDSKFDVTLSDIARVTGYNHSALVYGIKQIEQLAAYEDIKLLKKEVYAYCDEQFKSKVA